MVILYRLYSVRGVSAAAISILWRQSYVRQQPKRTNEASAQSMVLDVAMLQRLAAVYTIQWPAGGSGPILAPFVSLLPSSVPLSLSLTDVTDRLKPVYMLTRSSVGRSVLYGWSRLVACDCECRSSPVVPVRSTYLPQATRTCHVAASTNPRYNDGGIDIYADGGGACRSSN